MSIGRASSFGAEDRWSDAAKAVTGYSHLLMASSGETPATVAQGSPEVYDGAALKHADAPPHSE